MIEPIRAFVICPDQEILDSAIKFLIEKEFEADGVTNAESALANFGDKPYDIVIISGGIDNRTREIFRKEFSKVNKDFEFVEHFGSPENLLPELIEAFEE
ncbi:MAG: hypothetical protein H7329_05720 [Opitutaceae bacterium]|nr:hypothetical protein [Cytophagales bacterium]